MSRALVALVGSIVAAGVLVGAPAGAAVGGAARDPAAWTEAVCRDLVEFQGAALDARSVASAVATGPAPADRAGRKATVASLRAAFGPVRQSFAALDHRLGGRAPAGRGSAAVADALRHGYAPVGEAVADARAGLETLATTPPAQVPARVRRRLAALDRSLDRATRPLTRTERVLRRSALAGLFADVAVCRSIGPEWSFLPGTGAGPTPAPARPRPEVPGAVDLDAPRLLLPGRYRPTPEVAELAAGSSMTGLSRTYFYGAMPVVETGSPFVTDCPSADAANAQILGCYHDGRIYVLSVTRPELARIVTVTAAHEMLHAAYDAAAAKVRADVDHQLADFYATTTDERLRRIVTQYEARAPENLPTELHSLVPTQVAVLPAALDAYYAGYFRDRAPTVAAYDAYVAVFEDLIARYDELDAQAGDLRTQIVGLRSQSDAAAAEAGRLATQIDALRAQGRIGESNALVPAQNDAVRRAQSLNAQSNTMVDQYNALLDELNGIAEQLGGLQSALRPLG